MEFIKEVSLICDSLLSLFDVEKLIVFGIKRKENDLSVTDVDIAVISEVQSCKNDWLKKAYLEIDSDIPFDLFLYTPEEWDLSVKDNASFASRIMRKGCVVYEKKKDA